MQPAFIIYERPYAGAPYREVCRRLADQVKPEFRSMRPGESRPYASKRGELLIVRIQ